MMQKIIINLEKRRKLMFYILVAVAVLGIIVDKSFDIAAIDYIEEQYRLPTVYGLILYKIIELTALYFFFYYRPMVKYHSVKHNDDLSARFDKNAKRFFALVPHGSVVFGIIAYKLTGDVEYFLLFLTIAFTALFLVNPKKFFDYKKEY